MKLSLVMMCVGIVLIIYAMYILFYPRNKYIEHKSGISQSKSSSSSISTTNNGEISKEIDEIDNNTWALIILALVGAVGFLTSTFAYAEVNYDFSPLEGKWNYDLIRPIKKY